MDMIQIWHQKARPSPNERDFDVQLGCHLEEICEMLDTLEFSGGHSAFAMLKENLNDFSVALKNGAAMAKIKDRRGFLDSIADQVVTAIGCGHCANMNAVAAIRKVDDSNWSKFDSSGNPVRDAKGKITKGPLYQPPNLDGLF